MPETGRVLKFPARPTTGLASYSRAFAAAKEYLSLDVEERVGQDLNSVYGDPDLLVSLCSQLRDILNVKPGEVAAEAARIYAWLSESSASVGYFDEREYFLGESALLVAGATRLLGDRSESELWLDRAEAGYRHTINPNPSLARVAYLRLALRYDMSRHREVLELLPSVSRTFEKLGMVSDLCKCLFLEAMALKGLGHAAEAGAGLERILAGDQFQGETGIRGQALLNLGEIRSEQGLFDQALRSYQAALPLIDSANRPAAHADLKSAVGETLRRMGKNAAAVVAYRESVHTFLEIGMKTEAAYIRLVLAEALLAMGSPREAEWELLAALPAINEQQMVPEGIAAAALLQESVRQRKTDPAALADLRKYLQATN